MRTRVLVVVGLWAVSCGTPPPPQVCVPGKSEACIGAAGCAGGQQCNATGTGFGACDCGTTSPNDAGTTMDAGSAPDSGGVDSGQPDAGTSDAGTDAGMVDAGPVSCNPTPADGGVTGCGSGQRCTWITLTNTPTGRLGCVPNGNVPPGGACTPGTPGETTGFDDCTAGAVCINSVCKPVCRLADRSSCGPVNHCTRFSGLFANDPEEPLTGSCIDGCDPLTQRVSDGGTCGSNRGCYVLRSSTDSVAVCANAGATMHGQLITGTAFANSCVQSLQQHPGLLLQARRLPLRLRRRPDVGCAVPPVQRAHHRRRAAAHRSSDEQ